MAYDCCALCRLVSVLFRLDWKGFLRETTLCHSFLQYNTTAEMAVNWFMSIIYWTLCTKYIFSLGEFQTVAAKWKRNLKKKRNKSRTLIFGGDVSACSHLKRRKLRKHSSLATIKWSGLGVPVWLSHSRFQRNFSSKAYWSVSSFLL